MKNGVFWVVTPLALVRTDVSEEPGRLLHEGDKNR
jgi:hypothetical protein